MEITLKWHKVSDELPNKSGEYLIAKGFNKQFCFIAKTSYSSKFKLFNVHDWSEDISTNIEADYWAELSPMNKLF